MELLMSCVVPVVAWILAAAWIYLLVVMLIETEIDLIGFIIGVGLTFWLGYTAINPFYPYASLISLTALGSSGILMPLARGYYHRRAHAKIDADLLERACQAIEFDPKNFGAEIELAKLCYKHHLLEPAVVHMEKAVQIAPVFTFVEKKILAEWQQELARSQRSSCLVCPGCGTSNPVGQIRCSCCGAYLLVLLVRGGWLPEGMLSKILWAWLIVTGAGILALLAAHELPARWALPSVIGLLLAVGLAFWKVMRR
ncbi:MAG: hypothetical protein ABIN58_03715 [candidate division WOR-3 bacterium]